MVIPLAAVAVLFLVLTRPGTIRQLRRYAGRGLQPKTLAVALALAAVLVLARGNAWAALCLFGGALWLLGRAARGGAAPVTAHRRSPFLDMTFHHATGRLEGRVLAGRWAGMALDALARPDCLALFDELRRCDEAGARWLEPYLDRRFPGWRTAAQGDADSGHRRARFTSRMSEDEAQEVLGLARGASRDEIVRAHRTLMKKWHPDQGGTSALAARANEAKEVLLRRHD